MMIMMMIVKVSVYKIGEGKKRFNKKIFKEKI